MPLQGNTLAPTLSFENNPTQEKFVFDPSRRVCYAGAIRSGKTVGAGARKLFLAQLMPGSRFLIGRKDFNDLYNTTLKELFVLISASNGGDWRTPGPLVRKYDGQFHDLYLRTKGEDSVLHFRHLKQVSKQLGVETSGYFLDQFEEIDEEVFTHIHSRMTWWNAKRSGQFKDRFGFLPQSFETLACNPDPGWIKGFLFDQEDENSRFFRQAQDRFKLYEADVEQNRKNLPAGWIEEQERTHSKSWVSRFLKGSWDIKGGAVYEDFDEDVHGIEEFKIPAHWPRFISLDWGTNHPCAVHWGAVDEQSNLYVYDEYFAAGKIVSQVAEEIHKKTDKHSSAPWADDFGGLIVWMDPSTNQHHGVDDRTIMDEFRNHKIYGINANNQVNAGINKICERLKHDSTASPPIKPTVFIFRKKCPALIQGMKVYIWQPPNAQGISTDRPVKKEDDACLVGETLIETPDGLRRLDSIKKGDRVLGEHGFQKVMVSRCTGEKEIFRVRFSDGKSLEGTANHPIFVKDIGFVRLDSLRYGMIINHSRNETCTKKLGMQEKVIGETHRMDISISNEPIEIHVSSFIELFGKPVMELSRMVLKFITLISIPQIIESKILNVFHKPRIRKGILGDVPKDCEPILQKYEFLQRNGMEAPKGSNGIENMPQDLLEKLKQSICNVFIARRNSDQDITEPNSAPIIVNPRIGVRLRRTILRENVLSAIKHLWLIGIWKPKHVPVFVLDVCNLKQKRKVYNLTVEPTHTYYANGILTHNCDSFRYLCMAVLETESPGAKPRRKITNEMDKYIMDQFMLGEGK